MELDSAFDKIENFSGAYKSRLKDFRILTQDNKRKIISMHLGGIIIECFLKMLIVQKYDIIGRRNFDWFSFEAVKELSLQDNVLKEEYKAKATLNNPSHYFNKALELLGLSDNLPDNIVKKINLVYNPLTNTNNFIDLRYIDEKDMELEQFKEWLNSFKEVHNWLNEQKQRIEG